MTIFVRAIVLTFVVIFHTALSLAQSDERQRVATAYEQSGDIRNAARLWQELLTQNPSNDLYFDGVVRTLSSLDQYGSLVDIVSQRLQKKKLVKYYALLGLVQHKATFVDVAKTTWAEGVQKSSSASDFKEIAVSQIQCRQIDYAISTYLIARIYLKNKQEFADELAQLYITKGDIKNSLEEILAVFQKRKNYNETQGRISALLQSQEKVEDVAAALGAYSKDNEDDVNTQRLYIWFLRETKRTNEAFLAVCRLDKLARLDGREILGYADVCRKEDLYEIAEKAYLEVLSVTNKKSVVAQAANFGLAICGEARLRSQRLTADLQESTKQWEEVISSYKEIETKYPQSEQAIEALYRIASIYTNELNAITKAQSTYSYIISTFNKDIRASEAYIQLALIAIRNGNTESAQNSIESARENFPILGDRCDFIDAELSFYKGELTVAKEKYSNFLTKPKSEFTNDAIERLTLLTLNQSDTLQLQTYARAVFLAQQKKYDEVIEVLKPLITTKSDIAEGSLFLTAESYYGMNQYAKAEQTHRQLVQTYPESIFADKSFFSIGGILSQTGKSDQAILHYSEFLARFPRSIFAQDARDRIRRLRGDMK